MTNSTTSKALEYFEKNWDKTLEDLKNLIRIPSVSFKGFPKEQVQKSAGAVAELLTECGLKNVEILKMGDAHPYVYGEWLEAPDAPTLLLYAHHDVQPPGRSEVWKTKPFDPTTKEGPGGLRLYGRGSADDKAGIMIHVASIASYLKTEGRLPVNVKVLIEGEEEIGSGHLYSFLQQYQDRLSSDVLILTDTTNFDCGVPGLTTSLRGMVGVEIELRALEKTVHSGMWGGPLPDVAMGMSLLLSKLVDEEGRIAVPGIRDLMPSLDRAEEDRLRSLPFDLSRFREQAGLSKGVPVLRPESSPYQQIWREAHIMVNAIQSSSREQAGNVLNDTAWAKVSIRLAPGMVAKEVNQVLCDFLRENTPWGLQLDLHADFSADPWLTDPNGPKKSAFQAASRALKKGYGKDPVYMGCGGSIPFVQPFAQAMGGAPALLFGVEDPYTDAHGENESLLIEDLKKACRSQIYVFEEFSSWVD